MPSLQSAVALPQVGHNRTKSSVALALTFVAGFVDVTGALQLYQLFTAHMTGNTVKLGQHLIQHNWSAAILASCVLAAFVLGSILGRVAIEVGSRASVKSIASFTLALEFILLLAVAGHSRPAGANSIAVWWLLAMLAAAMGLQTATLTRIGALTIHTTFVTGMLNKFAQLFSHWLFRSYDVAHASPEGLPELVLQRRAAARKARFIFSIWILYVIGAVCGTVLSKLWALHALVIPCFALLGAIVADRIRPLSVEEEKDQSER
jgi:uncharacterized membrane protein YoaK (UPF0700 family)